MNKIKSLVTVFAFSLLVMSLPLVASAQWNGGNNRDRDRDDDYYGRNRDRDRDRNNGYYNSEQLKNTVKRLKNDSKDFDKFVERELNNRGRNNNGWGSWGNRNNRNDNLRNLTEDFKRAADRLEDRFDKNNLYKSQYEAQEVLNLANQLDRELRRNRLSYDISNYWNNIQRQVNEISNAYRNNNRNNNGNWKNRFPFPF